jgi:hypothetical protein
MQPTRWDLVLERKPIPVIEHLLEEVSKLFAEDLLSWPPVIDAFDPVTGASMALLLADQPERPDARLFRQAFRLTRFDLSRDFDALDDYWRNMRFLEVGLTPGDKPMLMMMTRFMSEQLLALGEATDGRVTRPRMLDALSRTERHFDAKVELK